jgi:hypothetical protein
MESISSWVNSRALVRLSTRFWSFIFSPFISFDRQRESASPNSILEAFHICGVRDDDGNSGEAGFLKEFWLSEGKSVSG